MNQPQQVMQQPPQQAMHRNTVAGAASQYFNNMNMPSRKTVRGSLQQID